MLALKSFSNQTLYISLLIKDYTGTRYVLTYASHTRQYVYGAGRLHPPLFLFLSCSRLFYLFQSLSIAQLEGPKYTFCLYRKTNELNTIICMMTSCLYETISFKIRPHDFKNIPGDIYQFNCSVSQCETETMRHI